MWSAPNLSSMAWRNLWRHRRRTILTLISIAFGVFLAVLMTAMQDHSFAEMIDTSARMSSGHVTVLHPEYLDTPKLGLYISNTRSLSQEARSVRQVERVMARISGQIMVSTARDSFGAGFLAYDPAFEDESSLAVLEGVRQGRVFERADERGIILGSVLARNLDLEVGARVVFNLMDSQGDITGGVATLTGIVETGTPSADASLCLLPIDTVRQMVGYGPEDSTELAVFIGDSRRSERVAADLNRLLGEGQIAVPWTEMKPELAGFIGMKVGGSRFMEILVALLVAAGIFNTMFVSVMERMREFGVMLALGYSPGQVFRMIMWESAWFALLGLVLAALITVGPYLHLSRTGLDLTMMMGGETEIAGIGFDPVLSVGIFPEHALFIALAAILATVASGLYPAWKAARVQPVETIRLV